MQLTRPAAHGLAPLDRARFLAAFPIRLGPDTTSGRAILEGRVVHVRQALTESLEPQTATADILQIISRSPRENST